MNDEEERDTSGVDQKVLSPLGRGGPWLPAVLASIGAGVMLSGIFAGATGIYGDVGNITIADMARESGRELVRLIVFSSMLLGAIRYQSWRSKRMMGELSLAAIRCIAVVALVEAVRVSQVQYGVLRFVLIGGAQYLLFAVCILSLFAMTIRETVLFTTGCAIGIAFLWVGSHLGTWLS